VPLHLKVLVFFENQTFIKVAHIEIRHHSSNNLRLKLSKVSSMGCKNIPAFAGRQVFSLLIIFLSARSAAMHLKKTSISQKILFFRCHQKTLDNFIGLNTSSTLTMISYSTRVIKPFLFVLFAISSLTAQENPYELSWKKDLILFGVGATLQTTGFILRNDVNPLTIQEINNLNSDDVLRIDRIATSYSSTEAQRISDVLLFGTITTPFLMLTHKRGRKGFLEIGLLSAEAVLLTTSLTTLSKVTSRRARPLAYNADFSLDEKQEVNARLSFFSGHTSSVAALSFCSAKVFADYFPESKWKPVVWSVAGFLPAMTGYLRVRGGKHFPTDTIVGYLVGGAFGYLIPHTHKKLDKEDRTRLSLINRGNGLGIQLQW